MNGILPTPEYELERHWQWPWWKFEMRPTDLLTTLHARFNTRTCPIQDPGAFIVDVRDCIEESPDIETFYAKMDERRDKRVRELERAWSNVCSLMMSLITSEPICGDPNCKSLNLRMCIACEKKYTSPQLRERRAEYARVMLKRYPGPKD